MFKGKANILLFGSFGLILLAIGLVAALDALKPNQSTGDLRARAAVTKTLQVTGTVTLVDEAGGTITVSDVAFADANRSGDPQNLGTWTVTVPAEFNMASVSPGSPVTIGIDAATFKATTHTMSALSITVQ